MYISVKIPKHSFFITTLQYGFFNFSILSMFILFQTTFLCGNSLISTSWTLSRLRGVSHNRTALGLHHSAWHASNYLWKFYSIIGNRFVFWRWEEFWNLIPKSNWIIKALVQDQVNSSLTYATGQFFKLEYTFILTSKANSSIFHWISSTKLLTPSLPQSHFHSFKTGIIWKKLILKSSMGRMNSLTNNIALTEQVSYLHNTPKNLYKSI